MLGESSRDEEVKREVAILFTSSFRARVGNSARFPTALAVCAAGSMEDWIEASSGDGKTVRSQRKWQLGLLAVAPRSGLVCAWSVVWLR